MISVDPDPHPDCAARPPGSSGPGVRSPRPAPDPGARQPGRRGRLPEDHRTTELTTAAAGLSTDRLLPGAALGVQARLVDVSLIGWPLAIALTGSSRSLSRP